MMLLLALLGGMLLNIMPCVIPVVVPKLLHVVRTAQQADDPAERRRLLWTNALAYTGGVLATLLSLAVLVLVLKHIGHRVGWGFQFQNPWFLVFMIGLLLVLGLGMLHVFPLQSSRHADDMKQLRRTRRRSPLLESFLTGLLVTFLGTPCTAPALGPALGYAFTAGDVEIVLLLAVVGLGLASPFLLIGAWTGWTRVLPRRVTERYDRIMRGMAFLLFGTAVWLLDVLAEGYGSRAALATVWFCLALAAAAWLFGLISDASERWRRRLLKLLPLVLAVGLFGCWVLDFSAPQAGRPLRLQSEVGIRWQPFSEQRLAELRRAGKTVFIDFTAEWCMNCKANEELFIETEATRELIEQLDVAAVMADHTRHDPVIQTWLERYGRAGVPMYLIFPACARNDQAILLPEILTSERLHAALKKAGPSRGGCPAAPPL
jgi:thiol:disulfide interchange protein DsbD